MPNERRPGQQNKVGLRSGRVDVVTLSSMRSSPPRVRHRSFATRSVG